jgi:hypothetical protein
MLQAIKKPKNRAAKIFLNSGFFWHTSCDVCRMAKKINDLKFAQENQGQAEITNRRPTSDSAALYLMQVRMPRLKISPQKKRLPIFVDAETREAVPFPVKIRHLG